MILFARGATVPAVSLDETHRVLADYYDVWSDLYGENFFGLEGQWCAANHVEMQTHIEHEENLPQLVPSRAISSNACAASRCPH